MIYLTTTLYTVLRTPVSHDNDTAVGWFNSQAGEGSTRTQEEIDKEKAFALRYLNCKAEDISKGHVEGNLEFCCHLAIAPVQDLLGLPRSARMNMPRYNRWELDMEMRTGAC